MARYQSHQDMLSAYRDRWNRGLKAGKVFFIILAVLMILAGIATFVYPLNLYTVVQAAVAAALLVHGFMQVVSFVRATGLFKDPMLVVTGVLNILLGVVLLMLPSLFTATTLSFIMGMMLIMIGAERISHASHMRYFGMTGTGVTTVSGVLNVILGIVFLLAPLFSSVVLSYLVSAYLVGTGLTLLIEAVSMRRIEL